MSHANTVREVMSQNLVTLSPKASVAAAAAAMRDEHIGAVLINDADDKLVGLVTDRDIVVRAIADGQDPQKVEIGKILSKPEHQLTPDSSVDSAIKMMTNANVRRIPVVENGHCVGIVSLGDLAVERDPKSTLGRISAAPSNN